MRFKGIVAALFTVILVWAGIGAPSASADTIYNYTGSQFVVCGYGCGPFSTDLLNDPNNAPANWASDYIIASISFANPLGANLTFADNTFSLLTAWTMKDALGYFSLSSAAGDVLAGDLGEGLPALVLSTDSNGSIVNYIMSTSPNAGSVGTGLAISNPPLQCPECNGFVIAGGAAVNTGSDALEWDAFTNVPGHWTNATAVPEPSSLVLTSLGLAAAMLMSAMKRKQRQETTS